VFLKNFLWLLAAVRAFVFSLKREIYKTNQAASIAVWIAGNSKTRSKRWRNSSL